MLKVMAIRLQSHILFRNFNSHRPVANLSGCGCRRTINDKSKRWTIRMVTKEPRKKLLKGLKGNFKLTEMTKKDTIVENKS